jgi:thioredoxin-related protein
VIYQTTKVIAATVLLIGFHVATVIANDDKISATRDSSVINNRPLKHTKIVDLINAKLSVQKAKSGNKAFVLYVAATHCAYCKKLNEEVIYPALNNAKFSKKLLLRRLWLNKEALVVDFNMNFVEQTDFIAKYDIKATPTLLFLNAKGDEIAERLVGYAPDTLYWARLEKSIDRAKAFYR